MYVLNKPLFIATPQEKALRVSWSDIQTQQRYTTKYGNDPPSRSSIPRWHKKFMETRSVLNTVRSGRLRTSAENIESERQAFFCSSTKSTTLRPEN